MGGSEDQTSQYNRDLVAHDMDSASTSVFDEYSNDPRFVESQRELRSLLFDTARSSASTRVNSPVLEGREVLEQSEPSRSSAASSTSTSFIKRLVLTGRRVTWLKNYINEVAPWLDMFDTKQVFGRRVPILARSSASLTYAILAISARQMELQQRMPGDYDSLQLYQESIKSLAPQLQARDSDIMATCVILCCLEMMSAAPRNWRKHLDGCAALFDSYGITGFSSGVSQAVFWCYARMDLCAAIISEGNQSVVLPLENWLPPNVSPAQAETLFCSSGIPDMYANYAVWLCARVSHLAWTRANKQQVSIEGFDQEPFAHSWHSLWTQVQNWAQRRPMELRELDFDEDAETSPSDPFPFILYSAYCAISSNQLYHAACLLLLEMKPTFINVREEGHIGSPLWHARRICGISITNTHHGSLNNAIQPLWLAGKLLSHPVEHRAIVDLMQRIEDITGWRVTWRIKDLKELWGYDRSDPPI